MLSQVDIRVDPASATNKECLEVLKEQEKVVKVKVQQEEEEQNARAATAASAASAAAAKEEKQKEQSKTDVQEAATAASAAAETGVQHGMSVDPREVVLHSLHVLRPRMQRRICRRRQLPRRSYHSRVPKLRQSS